MALKSASARCSKQERVEVGAVHDPWRCLHGAAPAPRPGRGCTTNETTSG